MDGFNFEFALPSIGTSQMSRNDQGALIVNQATAVIISAYLKHASETYTVLVENGFTNNAGQMRFDSTEIISLINNVQGALKTF